MKQRRLFSYVVTVMLAAMVIMAAGCGGGAPVGGGGGGSYSITGRIQIPNTTTGAARSAAALSAATGTVQLLIISGAGTETDIGDPVITDTQGRFSAVVSAPYSFETYRMVVKATVTAPDGATATLRSHVTSITADITPVTEAAYQIIDEKLALEGKTYESLTLTEVDGIETAVETAVGTSTDGLAVSLQTIVNNAKNTANFDASVQTALNDAVNIAASVVNYLVIANTPSGWLETQGDFAYMALTGSGVTAPKPTYNFLSPNPVNSDVEITTDGTYVYVLNRYNYDTVVVMNPANGFSVVANYSLKENASESTYNPYDIEVINATKAYVTSYEKDYLLIINPLTGERTGEISLADYTQHFEGESMNWDGTSSFVNDDIPEASKMVRVGTKVFVVVQNINRANYWATTDYSMLVVIDSTTDTALAGIDLNGNCGHNPTGDPVYANGKIYVACTANTMYPSGTEPAGVASVDPDSYVVTNIFRRQTGDVCAPQNLAIVSATKGYVTCLKAWPNSSVNSFNPATGVIDSDNPVVEGSFGFGLAIDPDGHLVVPSRDSSAPGLIFIDTDTDNVLYGGAVPVGLMPEVFTFISI